MSERLVAAVGEAHGSYAAEVRAPGSTETAAVGMSTIDTPAIGTPAIAPGMLGEDDGDGLDPSLLGNQPAWQRDGLAVSARVRALLATLRPVVVQVLNFWDHVARSVRIGSRIVEIDPSGSYRVR